MQEFSKDWKSTLRLWSLVRDIAANEEYDNFDQRKVDGLTGWKQLATDVIGVTLFKKTGIAIGLPGQRERERTALADKSLAEMGKAIGVLRMQKADSPRGMNSNGSASWTG